MTMALRKMNINTPKIRSSKRRENHFYTPYTPSKRRATSDHLDTISMSRAETFPLSGPAPLKANNVTDVNALSLHQPNETECWGKLISKTPGKPDIALIKKSTSLGKPVDFVDMHTGERMQEFSNAPVATVC